MSNEITLLMCESCYEIILEENKQLPPHTPSLQMKSLEIYNR
jgi:hypothetical protein